MARHTNADIVTYGIDRVGRARHRVPPRFATCARASGLPRPRGHQPAAHGPVATTPRTRPPPRGRPRRACHRRRRRVIRPRCRPLPHGPAHAHGGDRRQRRLQREPWSRCGRRCARLADLEAEEHGGAGRHGELEDVEDEHPAITRLAPDPVSRSAADAALWRGDRPRDRRCRSASALLGLATLCCLAAGSQPAPERSPTPPCRRLRPVSGSGSGRARRRARRGRGRSRRSIQTESR